MLKKSLLALSFVAGPGFAQISAEGCIEDVCEPLEFDQTVYVNESSRSKKLAKTIADSTGLLIEAVDAAVDSMRRAARNAGFDSFKGTFTGPRGKAEFSYNFKTGQIGFVFIPSNHGARSPLGKAIK